MKPRQLPPEFIELSLEMQAAKTVYDEVLYRYRSAIEVLAVDGWRTSYVAAISPFAYPTVRKWMIEAMNGSVDHPGN